MKNEDLEIIKQQAREEFARRHIEINSGNIYKIFEAASDIILRTIQEHKHNKKLVFGITLPFFQFEIHRHSK